MKRLAMLLVLLTLAAPAWSTPKKATIDQLKDLLTSLQKANKTDQETATAIKQVDLTEELTGSTMQSLGSLIPGPLSTEQIYVLQARSALLPPPPAELPADTALDPAAQQALLAKAQDYVSKAFSQLPSLTASRMIARFQDSVEAVHTYTGMNHGTSQDTDPNWQGDDLNIRLVTNITKPVESQGGLEKPPDTKDKTNWGPNNLVASVGPLLTLPQVLQEANASGTLKFLRWELINGKKTAVFSFSVDKKKTKFSVQYCCFPDTDTAGVLTTGAGIGNPQSGGGAPADGNLQTISEWKPFKASAGYRGELFIDPDLGVVVRTITQADFKKSDFVHNESIRTDFGAQSIAGKTLVVPIQSITAAEIVPNGASFAAHYAVRHSFVTQTYSDYKLAQ